MLLVTGALIATVVGLTTAADRAPQSGAAPRVSRSDRSDASVSALVKLDKANPQRDWTSIVLHHSATSGGDVAAIDKVHRQQRDSNGQPWLGIGYHFVIGNGRPMGDGEVEATFRWRRQLPGAHAGRHDYNEHGIGICLIGNFDEAPPTEKQLAAARELVRHLAQQYRIPRPRILRHRDVQSTACPGRRFPWEEFRAAVAALPEGA